jgi:hypothetical protein
MQSLITFGPLQHTAWPLTKLWPLTLLRVCCFALPDPTHRITIDQIYHHPWYVKNLPPGVLEMNSQPQPAPEGIQVGGWGVYVGWGRGGAGRRQGGGQCVCLGANGSVTSSLTFT